MNGFVVSAGVFGIEFVIYFLIGFTNLFEGG